MRGDAEAIAFLKGTARGQAALPQPVVAEISYGITRLPDSKRQKDLQKKWGLLSGQLARAEWDDRVSIAFGRIKAQLSAAGQIIEDFDIAIAAHALATGGVLVTDNLKHFKRVADLSLLGWRA